MSLVLEASSQVATRIFYMYKIMKQIKLSHSHTRSGLAYWVASLAHNQWWIQTLSKAAQFT